MENSIFDVSGDKIKKILSNQSSYANGIDLPEYIDFQPILDSLFNTDDSNLTAGGANSSSDVNFRILLNKDGRYSWRLIELMHPVLYVHLANIISEAWDGIAEHTRELLDYNSRRGLTCASQLWCTDNTLSNPQLSWWRHFEQQTLFESIKFNHIHKIDIFGCYDSVYTHSIAWAIHGRNIFQDTSSRNNFNLVGNKIDKLIRAGREDQTNGIPQGSVLCDLIAELVLIDIDNEILNRLEELELIDADRLRIIRYVDDYNILTKNDQTGEAVIEVISEVLASRRMRLNELKVVSSDNIASCVIKPDKIPLLSLPQSSFTNPLLINNESVVDIPSHNRALQIYDFSLKYPNSGSLKKLLIEFRRLCDNPSYLDGNTAPAVISVISKIATRNPKTITVCVSIIERALFATNYDSHLIDNLQYMFDGHPFTDYIDIWLQRICIGCNKEYSPRSLMTKCVSRDHEQQTIWNNSWIRCSNVKNIMESSAIVNQSKLDELSPDIDVNNLMLWSYDDWV